MAIGDIISNLLDKKETKTASFLWNLLPTKAGSKNIQSAAQNLRKISSIESSRVERIENLYRTLADAGKDFSYIDKAIAKEFETPDKPESSLYVMTPINGGTTLIDVVNDYEWTTTPKSGRGTAPYIIMREMQPKTGAELQRAIYAVDSLTDSVKDVGGKAEDLINSTATKFNAPASLKSAISTTAEKFYDVIEYINDAKSKVKSGVGLESSMQLSKQGHLASYDNLYNCDYTGWNFKLPYFENSPLATPQNTFTSGSHKTGASYLADGAEFLNNIIGGAQSTLAQLTSNEERSTETPKSYSMATDGAQFSFKFPLLNTGDEYQAATNYQLVQLLKYQSRPYRSTRNLIVPINIYEVFIPGIRYIPYAFIRNVNVEFQGVRMPLDMQIMFDNKPTNITAIIPEAYMVNIELQSLTNETGNFMIESMVNQRGL
jgi:hypothetical protein